MRRYIVSVNGQDHVVEIDDDLVSVNGKEVTASITTVDHQAAAAADSISGAGAPATLVSSAGSGPSDLKAPMPGVILEVHAKVGDQVQRGDLIAILEAMKMRNEIRATSPGTVASIDVSSGDNVVYGQLIAHLEG